MHAWDDSDVSRAKAEAAGVPTSDINARDWRSFAALILSPGVPFTFPSPHRVVTLAEAVGVPVIGDIELFARAVNALPPAQRPKLVGITGTNGKSTTTVDRAHSRRSRQGCADGAETSAKRFSICSRCTVAPIMYWSCPRFSST